MSVNDLDISVGVVTGLRDYARLPLYVRMGTDAQSQVKFTFTTDKDFWTDVLNRRIGTGSVVELNRFVLSPYVPRSPGTYWKAESAAYRQAAERHVIESKKYTVYGPFGKTLHVLGGMGSVRMAPSRGAQLLSASGLPKGWDGAWNGNPYLGHTMPTSWTGVPVLIEGAAYDQFRHLPDMTQVTLRGALSALPQEYAKWLFGNEGVPRLRLSVSSPAQIIPLEDPPSRGYYEVCPWTLFEYCPGSTALRRYAYSYFHHNVFERDQADEAAEFIRNYVSERSGTILIEYDAVEPRLDALLSISELQNPDVNRIRLRDLIQQVKHDTFSERDVHYDRIPELLTKSCNNGDVLRRFALDYLDVAMDELIGRNAGVVEMVEVLVAECKSRGRLEDLVCAMVTEFPVLSDALNANSTPSDVVD